MLADLLGWIKQIIYLLIFLTLVLQILPNGNYRKYVKFFAGMIFVVTLLGPVVSLFIENFLSFSIELKDGERAYK